MVLKKIRTLINPQAKAGTLSFGEIPLAPKRPFYAIGDIHGRADLIEPLLEKIDADLQANSVKNPALVFIGDYIDHGPQSDSVLAQIYDLSRQMPDNVVCLLGNHEQMMLDFIDDPVNQGVRWFRNGGLKTMACYDIHDINGPLTADDLVETAVLLSLTLPDGIEDWLRSLPTIWTSGNVSCAHAGLDPLVPPNQQKPETLLWGHPDFDTVTRLDKHWVISGQSIVKKPYSQNGKIAINTAAWHTGQLSAVAVTHDEPRFITTQPIA